MQTSNEGVAPLPGAAAPVSHMLRAEGLALFIAATATFFLLTDQPWWLYFALFLFPDLALFARLAGERPLAITYDAVHMTIGPLALGMIGLLTGSDLAIAIATIWLAHIGIDRAVGYGLRYPESYESTHLGPVGQLKKGLAI